MDATPQDPAGPSTRVRSALAVAPYAFALVAYFLIYIPLIAPRLQTGSALALALCTLVVPIAFLVCLQGAYIPLSRRTLAAISYALFLAAFPALAAVLQLPGFPNLSVSRSDFFMSLAGLFAATYGLLAFGGLTSRVLTWVRSRSTAKAVGT